MSERRRKYLCILPGKNNNAKYIFLQNLLFTFETGIWNAYILRLFGKIYENDEKLNLLPKNKCKCFEQNQIEY